MVCTGIKNSFEVCLLMEALHQFFCNLFAGCQCFAGLFRQWHLLCAGRFRECCLHFRIIDAEERMVAPNNTMLATRVEPISFATSFTFSTIFYEAVCQVLLLWLFSSG